MTALALIDTGPDPDAFIPQGLLSRLLLAPLPGRLLWPLRTEATIRKAMRTAFTRPIGIPDALIEDARGMTHRALAATSRASLSYLGRRSLPARLTALGLPVLVIFGTEDHRWRSSSAAAYRLVPEVRVELLPGVGHTPMQEDPGDDRQAAAGLCRRRRGDPEVIACPRRRTPDTTLAHPTSPQGPTSRGCPRPVRNIAWPT